MAKKTHSIAVQVPQTREAAEAEMRQLGQLRIRVAEIDNSLKEASQKLIQQAKDDAEPLVTDAKRIEDGLMLYAAAHRAELTDGNTSKRGKMLSGHFDWRKLPESVSLRGVPAVIKRIQAAIEHAEDSSVCSTDPTESQGFVKEASKLSGFLRTKVEVNKDAMLAEPTLAKSISGVSIKSPGERLEITVYENSLND